MSCSPLPLPGWGRRDRAWLLLAVLTAALLGGCRARTTPTEEVPEGPVWFEDATERVGLRFHHDAGPGADYRMPRVMGSGGAFLDVDNDGRLDLYLIHNGGPDSKARNQLY